MKLQTIDLIIIAAYLVITLLVGIFLQKQAGKSRTSYMLGGNKIPWYFLGLSNASGMFDISGTMWMVTLGFVYGLKSVWIPWLWPVFNQIFMMVYLSAWLRRSNVATGGEWIETRFGKGVGATLSHTIVVVFAIIACLGFLAYGFIGLGKFVEIFVPWETVSPWIPFDVPPQYIPHLYGVALTLFAVFYSILGGMSGIVLADVIQYAIMTISAIVVAVIAYFALQAPPLNVPDGWMSPFFGWELDMNWSGIIDEVNEKIVNDKYSFFSLFFGMMLFQGILKSIAGPTPSYDMQKILSTRTASEAAKMSGSVPIILLPIRYLMITGFVVLAILFYNELNLTGINSDGETFVDFERILPAAISQFVPVGFMGLLLAGLLAAFMSTFAGTLNAAQAYIVNDLYLKYIAPDATAKTTRNANYITGVVMVIISIILGVYVKDINSVLQWIVSGLYGGYVASNILKWHWWRYNGHGFFWGMLAGLIPAMLFPKLPYFEDMLPLYYFPIILVLSFLGCIIGTYCAEPTDEETLKSFYKRVKPWGIWGPIKAKVIAENPHFTKGLSLRLSVFNIVIGIIGQTALTILPIYLILAKTVPTLWALIVSVGCIIIMKKTWWDKLNEFDKD